MASRTDAVARWARAFTLVELLVVVAVVALLVAILAPSLASAKAAARDAKCLANIHVHLVGLTLYAGEHHGALASPSADIMVVPSYTNPAQPPLCAIATFQLWAGQNKQATGLGVLVEGNLMPWEAAFCHTDADADPRAEQQVYATASRKDAWGSYLYRQFDAQFETFVSTDPAVSGRAPNYQTRLERLRFNAAGEPYRVLVMDAQSVLEWPDLPIKRPHEGTRCAVGRIDGAAQRIANDNAALTLRKWPADKDAEHLYEWQTAPDPVGSPDKFKCSRCPGSFRPRLHEVFETADALGG